MLDNNALRPRVKLRWPLVTIEIGRRTLGAGLNALTSRHIYIVPSTILSPAFSRRFTVAMVAKRFMGGAAASSGQCVTRMHRVASQTELYSVYSATETTTAVAAAAAAAVRWRN